MAGFNPSTDMPMDWAFEETPPFQIPPVMSVKMADEIIKSTNILKELEENSAMSAALHTFGVEIDWQQVHDSYQEARITILYDENQKLNKALDEVVDAHNKGIMKLIDAVEEREHLREDVDRLLRINAMQAKTLGAFIQLHVVKKTKKSNPSNSTGLHVDFGDHYITMQSGNHEYQPGDQITFNQFNDLSWNGTYVLGADQVFRKVNDVNESVQPVRKAS
jgi:hypothetical protein